MLIIFKVTVPEGQDADAFSEFMRETYFPAVYKGPTRVGQVTSLALLRGMSETHTSTHTFLLHMGYSGLATGKLRVEDNEVESKFNSFGAQMENIGAYEEVATWSKTDLP